MRLPLLYAGGKLVYDQCPLLIFERKEMFSIQFTRNGQEDCTQVHIRINMNLPVKKCIFVSSWECDSQYAAALLCKHLEEEYHNLIKKAHQGSYEQGYNDGKQHKRKKTWFRRNFCEHDQEPCH